MDDVFLFPSSIRKSDVSVHSSSANDSLALVKLSKLSILNPAWILVVLA